MVLEGETNKINTLIIGKSDENHFGLVEQQQLTNKFLRLIRQKKKFHLCFGDRRNNFNSNDVLIYNVLEDTILEPTTPQTLLREITVSSAMCHLLLQHLTQLCNHTKKKKRNQSGDFFLLVVNKGWFDIFFAMCKF